MDLSLYEQETIINFCEEEKTAGIYTHNKILRQKLAVLARDRPEDCRLVKASRSGRAVDYTIPKSWINLDGDTGVGIGSVDDECQTIVSNGSRLHRLVS